MFIIKLQMSVKCGLHILPCNSAGLHILPCNSAGLHILPCNSAIAPGYTYCCAKTKVSDSKINENTIIEPSTCAISSLFFIAVWWF